MADAQSEHAAEAALRVLQIGGICGAVHGDYLNIVKQEALSRLTTEELLERIPPEELLSRIPPERLLEGLSPWLRQYDPYHLPIGLSADRSLRRRLGESSRRRRVSAPDEQTAWKHHERKPAKHHERTGLRLARRRLMERRYDP